MPRQPRTAFLLVASLVLACVSVAFVSGCGKRQSAGDSGDSVCPTIDKSVQPLRRDFEDADGKVRIVATFTPTCGDCLAIMKALDDILLPAVPSPDFEMFVVWCCVIPPDVEVKARALAKQHADPRIHHYWDPSARYARAIGTPMGAPPGSAAYGVVDVYGRNDTWDPTGHMGSEPADYNALLNGWLPSEPLVRCGKHPKLLLPPFDLNMLQEEIGKLLTEPDSGAAR